MTAFVHYECLAKPRTSPTEADFELRERLKQEQSRGKFASHSCSIGDLQAIADLESRKKLGKGELSLFERKGRGLAPTLVGRPISSEFAWR